jgi:putative nucleotidyltransferase with HDIG domain
MQTNEIEISKKLRQAIRPSRYRHTLGVTDTAVLLAACYGADMEKARIAGLLHDCGKEAASALEHGAVGAKLAKEEYGINDEEILSAICWHTTGRPGMTLLEKIIFVADYIEPCRDGRLPVERLRLLRKTAFQDLDKTVVMILEDTFAFLKSRKTTIDKRSVDTYGYYKELVSGKE